MTAPTPRALGERLLAAFTAAGAVPVEAPVLLPANTLLDLYGEDIRARAYVTRDPLQGEMMLRPDFTVPVVQRHMAQGAEPARYAYLGEVFRQQDRPDPARAREYLQAGFEVFDRNDPASADAEVFALFHRLLRPLSPQVVTGDAGLLRAAIAGLSTTQARKAALLRHLWRPARFAQLLDRFCGRTPPPPSRRVLLERLRAEPAAALIAGAGPLTGLRTTEEITARLEALAEDAAAPPLAEGERALLDRLMSLHAPAPQALATLRGLARDHAALTAAADRMEARLDAMAARGIDPAAVAFEAGYGLTSLEYYDGFVFGFRAGRNLPPVAVGGRYDALCAILGGGRSIEAVGGIIRPAVVAALGGGLAEC